MTGGSVGAQIGGTEIDVILVIMNRSGVEHLLSNQVELGGEISSAAGPVGRAGEASTDLQMQAQILSYSRSRGLFAGVTVNGSVIKEDMDANTRFYEKALSSEDIVFGRAGSSPASVGELKAALRPPQQLTVPSGCADGRAQPPAAEFILEPWRSHERNKT
jgi:lipid-binding SYLF domain-containing protein